MKKIFYSKYFFVFLFISIIDNKPSFSEQSIIHNIKPSSQIQNKKPTTKSINKKKTKVYNRYKKPYNYNNYKKIKDESNYNSIYDSNSTNSSYSSNKEYDYRGDYSEGYYIVSKNGKYTFMDSYNNKLKDFIFDDVSSFKDGLATVKLYGETKKLAKNGNIFDEVGSYYGGLYPVKVDDKWGYVDYNYNYKISTQFDYVYDLNTELARVKYYGNYKLLNKKKNFFVSVGSFYEDRAWFEHNGKYGFIDSNYYIVLDPKYDKVSDFEDGLAKVHYPGYGWYYFNKYNNLKDYYDYKKEGENNKYYSSYNYGIDSFKRALELNETSEIYDLLGDAYLKKNETSMAIDMYKKSIKISSSSSYAFSKLGDIYEKQSNLDLALDMYEKACKNDYKFCNKQNRLKEKIIEEEQKKFSNIFYSGYLYSNFYKKVVNFSYTAGTDRYNLGYELWDWNIISKPFNSIDFIWSKNYIYMSLYSLKLRSSNYYGGDGVKVSISPLDVVFMNNEVHLGMTFNGKLQYPIFIKEGAFFYIKDSLFIDYPDKYIDYNGIYINDFSVGLNKEWEYSSINLGVNISSIKNKPTVLGLELGFNFKL